MYWGVSRCVRAYLLVEVCSGVLRCVEVCYPEFLPLQADGSCLYLCSLRSVSSRTCVWSVEVTAFRSPGCWRNDATGFRRVLGLPAHRLLLSDDLHKNKLV